VVDSAAPNGRVTLAEEATLVSRSTQTNAEGGYVFAQLNPATYRLEVEALVFKNFHRPSVIGGAQAVLVVDITLEVDAVAGRVELH
jgi:hypothetical protein